MVTLESLRQYCQLDADCSADELAVLEGCLAASIAWWAGAGVPEGTNNPMYDIGVKMLASSWFSARGSVTGTALHDVPQSIYAIKHHLCTLPDAAEQTDVSSASDD